MQAPGEQADERVRLAREPRRRLDRQDLQERRRPARAHDDRPLVDLLDERLVLPDQPLVQRVPARVRTRDPREIDLVPHPLADLLAVVRRARSGERHDHDPPGYPVQPVDQPRLDPVRAGLSHLGDERRPLGIARQFGRHPRGLHDHQCVGVLRHHAHAGALEALFVDDWCGAHDPSLKRHQSRRSGTVDPWERDRWSTPDLRDFGASGSAHKGGRFTRLPLSSISTRPPRRTKCSRDRAPAVTLPPVPDAAPPPAHLWLVPAPASVRLAGATLRLGPRLTYRGPDPAAAFRLLHAPAQAHRIALLPGAPAEGLGGVSAIDVRDPAGPVHPQGYRLAIDERTIVIEALPGPGLRHALVTVAQLLRRFGRLLPTLEIDDHPLFPIRGVMLDISRDKVPTMASLFALVDTLELLKINHLQLYTEHTFAYAGHEDAWAGASPITPDEARELDAYCARRGVDLAPNQNTLGHLARWLRLPRYNHLSEVPGLDSEWTFRTPDGRPISRRGPFSLCPTDPASIAFVRGLLDELLPCFTSAIVNIGCDEAHDIGQGRSRGGVAERGYEAVFLSHLHAVADIARAHAKRVQFWADMVSKSPAGSFPPDSTALVWGYESDSDFAGPLARLRARGIDAWVCPGTSSWRSIVGRGRVRRANLAAAARCAGRASGLMVTDWGDLGHRQQWPVSLVALADAAARAWAGPDASADQRGVSLHALNDPTGTLAPFVDELADADSDLNDALALRNAGALFTELHRAIADPPGERAGSLEEWQRVRNRLAGLRARLESIPRGTAGCTAGVAAGVAAGSSQTRVGEIQSRLLVFAEFGADARAQLRPERYEARRRPDHHFEFGNQTVVVEFDEVGAFFSGVFFG
ncbi:MAG TPA: hypothetical protein DEB06_06870, partial [Phycisphaerales bacterium]|nr:hypothetical protein [Phycisphaerales bacterium]